MKSILVNSSICIEESRSRRLIANLVNQIKKSWQENVIVTERDLTIDPVPHFRADTVLGFSVNKATRFGLVNHFVS